MSRYIISIGYAGSSPPGGGLFCFPFALIVVTGMQMGRNNVDNSACGRRNVLYETSEIYNKRLK